MGQSLDAIVSIGIAEMCICTSCGTYCTRFCSNSTFSIATETCAVGTARGAAAHFRDTNRKYGIRRLSHQSFKSKLYRIRFLQSFEVGLCLKPHISHRYVEKCRFSAHNMVENPVFSFSVGVFLLADTFQCS